MRVKEDIKGDIVPNNILMIGATGVGKTEIARRLAKIANAPFTKVEASKFTEVGYVGRDVESMVRDLVEQSVNLVKEEKKKEVQERAEQIVEDIILDALIPPPYSHTPKHSGARQPGMTGQVKEEILTRFAELGIRVHGGQISVRPALLRSQEFCTLARSFRFLDIDGNWQTIDVPESSLAFTWCQVPIIYRLVADEPARLEIELDDGNLATYSELTLPAEISAELFARNGRVRKVTATLDRAMLFEVH